MHEKLGSGYNRDMERSNITGWMIGLVVSIFFLLPSTSAQAEKYTVTMPWFDNNQHAYFYDLLISSFAAIGHTLTIQSVRNYPHQRLILMLETGELSAMYLIESAKRNRELVPIEVGLTNKLIGKRILLVPEGNIHQFRDVRTLDDFIQEDRTAGLGESWFDVEVWRHNGLKVEAFADWTLIYGIVARKDRGLDYFPRGFIEVLGEVALHPEVAVEPHLMFVYDKDFLLYLSPRVKGLKAVFTRALREARDSGLMDRLLKKHFAHSYAVLKPEQRTIISLALPSDD